MSDYGRNTVFVVDLSTRPAGLRVRPYPAGRRNRRGRQFRPQDVHLGLQSFDDMIVLFQVISYIQCITLRNGFNAFRSVCVLQRIVRVLELRMRRRHVGYHDGPAATPKGVL